MNKGINSLAICISNGLTNRSAYPASWFSSDKRSTPSELPSSKTIGKTSKSSNNVYGRPLIPVNSRDSQYHLSGPEKDLTKP
ncbi:hypothetical protein DAPPUDRAFT_327838 [Daphnia pulex]|uniref:Uncharacterized protein n=1 Tax=Daphnia pulex TaxID=6669 RepID=E9HBY1_DAPPU|nr:hypothetical protein DAPPUDRAFT_327838 [Daphnia pulex]|eukprot:EFX70752.1 hypothetical protein DAPPUDRAFT_327838 [Daphnia pulex]